MSKKIKVLDHGYVKIIETWGSDRAIIEAARMSTNKGFLGWGEPCATCRGKGSVTGVLNCSACKGAGSEKPGDEKLLRYLWSKKHMSPFEFAGAVIEVQAPIFVFREWHRHRTQSYNEMSARYTPLPDLNYVPSVERLMIGSDGKNKQTGTVIGAEALSEIDARRFQRALFREYNAAELLYQDSLKVGVPKELARVCLPVGRYSRMRATANLRNWLQFLSLRSTEKNPDAQWEIRQFADTLFEELRKPRYKIQRTLALFSGEAQ